MDIFGEVSFFLPHYLKPISQPGAKAKAGAEPCKIICPEEVRNRGEPCKPLGDTHMTDSRKSTKLGSALIT